MRRSLFIIFSLLLSSPTLVFSMDEEKESASSQPPSPKESEAQKAPTAVRFSIDDGNESPPSQPPSPKESEAQKAPAAAGSDSLESIIEEEIQIVVEGHSKRSPRETIRFSSKEERAYVQTNIGTLYCNAINMKDLNAIGNMKKFTEAMRWFKKAAAQGHAEAQYSIGMLYDYGLGVPPNHVKAMKWYLLAADQGHAGAQYSIGMLYDVGLGVTSDPAMAMKYYLLAAVQNHASAQNNIGLLYAKGEGVPQDNNEALKWFQGAAAQEHEAAKGNIERLNENISIERPNSKQSKRKTVRFHLSIPRIGSKK